MNFMEINLTMLDEAIKMRRDLKAGKISHENYMAQFGGMTQIGKIMDRHLKFINFERINKKSLRNVEPDMIGYDPEKEKVNCPGLNGEEIERNKCLDYSGENKFPECPRCETGIETKTLLLGEK